MFDNKWTKYCVQCGKYATSKHNCEYKPAIIYKEYRAMVDKLYRCGLLTGLTREENTCLNPNEEDIQKCLYKLSIQIYIRGPYPNTLWDDLPEGWTFESGEIESLLSYNTKYLFGESDTKGVKPAITALEAYLDGKDPDMMKALITLGS